MIACEHPDDQVRVYARRLLESGLSECESICECGARWLSEGIAPQEGPQYDYFECEADIVFYGGGAGSGKTFSIIVEPARYFYDPQFTCITFRRTTGQLKGGQSIWEESLKHYPRFGGVPHRSDLFWRFPSGATSKFAHLQHEGDVEDHQGKPYASVNFDELPHFTSHQFWYLVSRMRTLSGVRPYIRATMNPVPESDPTGGWIRKMIDWWIGPDGYAIPERSGVIRYFVRVDDELIWADTAEELIEQYPRSGKPRSFTFISANLDDNKILKDGDPDYESNLLALPRVERERLRHGNWNISPAAGLYFQRGWFAIVDKRPALTEMVRGWDLAASKPTPENPDPAWTRGVLMGRDKNGRYWLLDVVSLRGSPMQVRELIRKTAELDGLKVKQTFWQDPGQAGKDQAHQIKTLLTGRTVRFMVAREDKITYAGPLSTQCEAGNVTILRADWNGSFFSEGEAFPDGKHKDQVDAASRAFLGLDNSLVERWKKAMANR